MGSAGRIERISDRTGEPGGRPSLFLGGAGRRSATLLFCIVVGLAVPGDAQVCGDADGNGQVTVTDGVNVLRTAAGLSQTCRLAICDMDGSGAVTVTDGVNVLRSVAGLAATANCGRDPAINSVADGPVFGTLTKISGGLIEPAGAPKTVQKVTFAASNQFVQGRVNTVTIEYDIGAATAQGAIADDLSLIVASSLDQDAPSPAVFQLPVTSPKNTVSVALNLRDDIPVTQFQLRLANGAGGHLPFGQIEKITVVVIRDTPPQCSNGTLDGNETCDPPGSRCATLGVSGFCDAECNCEPFSAPTPIPGSRFVDHGETIMDTQLGLEWEKKTTAVGSGANPADPHDVDNSYAWCLDANGDLSCDNGQAVNGSNDGPLFTQFLQALNTPPCFSGHCDWRLPTMIQDGGAAELETLIAPNAPGCGSGAPCIAQIFGPTIAEFYWSGTANPTSAILQWGTIFRNGTVDDYFRFNAFRVRAVRSAHGGPAPTPIPAPRFVDNGKTVIDTKLGLEWEKKTTAVGSGMNPADPHDVDNVYTWCRDANADFACDTEQTVNGPSDGPLFTSFLEALNTPPCFAGHCDWRLPTVIQDGGTPELETLIDPNVPGCDNDGPCIAPVFGPTGTEFYWSGVTSAASPIFQWGVIFSNGTMDDYYKFNAFRVRAVRSAGD